jgi:hypothetical protein
MVTVNDDNDLLFINRLTLKKCAHWPASSSPFFWPLHSISASCICERHAGGAPVSCQGCGLQAVLLRNEASPSFIGDRELLPRALRQKCLVK